MHLPKGIMYLLLKKEPTIPCIPGLTLAKDNTQEYHGYNNPKLSSAL
jgi:hypothetical protein